jgi:hypothetical protein
VIVNGPGPNSNAQNYGGYNSAASSQSLSRAKSTAKATGGGGGAGGTGGTGGSAAGGAATSATGAVNVTTSGDASRNPPASAIAPAISTFNSCAGAATSGALSTGLFSASLGLNPGFDEVCRLHELHQDRAAIAYLCRSDRVVRQAFRDIGTPCPQDIQAVPVVAVGGPVAAPVTAQTSSQQEYPYDYCFTRDAGDKNQHKECNTGR